MPTKYAYSYDREDYTGTYDTPQQALQDAIRNAEGISSPPTTIYIGTIVEADPQATDHAERIIESMNRRAHVDIGDSAARYLKHVTPEQAKDLDKSIAQTIVAWLKRHNLMPTFVRIRGIQEYPVPYPGSSTMAVASGSSEVQDIGTDNSGDLAGL